MRLLPRFALPVAVLAWTAVVLPPARVLEAGPQSATATLSEPASAPGEAGDAGPALARTVLFVRHAEKLSLAIPDPALSPEGEARAQVLAETLREAGVTHLFSSEFVRTRTTLAPLAEALGLEVQVIPARDGGAQLEALRALPPGAVAVVSGHSNTTPAMVRALGGDAPPSLDESVYDRLFVVTLPSGATPGSPTTSLTLRYGAFSGG